MTTVDIHEAKTWLCKLIEAVKAGEDVIITRSGKPVARLMPFEASKPPRRLGLLSGRLSVPDDFNAPLPEEMLRSFYTPL
ncbi:MAG: type II toxin-antitoxin system Phd/YefM family antitoxin [Methylibium sp.]|uniref:type II toxin-antitoxin system Phd/YefM family antitoxin n=1 Tax=Methylibium sp. TaxID=2067992 RepID=UPI0017A3B101|nr:type II toxin-antitoxin system Phd/YefM family antitoxin [Methylibium sp.]MBA3596109.1 type II toxin-antitoxin system Phd/YefM family antitoxin [Methylibium sp.]